MTIDLEKELVAQKKSTITSQNQELVEAEKLLATVQNILETDGQQDIRLLELYGFNTAIKNARQHKEHVEEIKRSISRDSRVFNIAEIKEIAIKYHLRFLETELYKGAFPSDLPAKIREAISTCPNTNNRYYDKTPMILAPKEAFNLQSEPEDPLFFLPVDNNNNYYLVHKWGNDLSTFRAIRYWSHRTKLNNFLFECPLFLFVGFLLVKLGVFIGTNFHTGWGVGYAIITTIIYLISFISIRWGKGHKSFISEYCWNREFK